MDQSSPTFVGFPEDQPRQPLHRQSKQSDLDSFLDLSFRPIQLNDRTNIQHLHEECFPVQYTPTFYDFAVRGKMSSAPHRPLFSVLAVVRRDDEEEEEEERIMREGGREEDPVAGRDGDGNDGQSSAMALCLPTSEAEKSEEDEQVVGQKQERLDGIAGAIITQFVESSTVLDFNFLDDPHSYPLIAYILTLSTSSDFRRRGLATKLLERALAHARSNRNCGAVYLHVITYNVAAIRFYENQGFVNIGVLGDYYFIDGVHHDAFFFVLHVNGAKMPMSFAEEVGNAVAEGFAKIGNFFGWGNS